MDQITINIPKKDVAALATNIRKKESLQNFAFNLKILFAKTQKIIVSEKSIIGNNGKVIMLNGKAMSAETNGINKNKNKLK